MVDAGPTGVDAVPPAPVAARDRLAAALAEGVLGVLARLPEQRGLALGDRFGRSWAALHGPRSRDARINLRIAFPTRSEAWRERVLAASLSNLGRSLVELARLSRWGPEELRERVQVEGLEHLERAQAQGGAIALTAHFGSWELLAAAMGAHGIPAAIVHRPRDNAALDALVNQLRSSGGAELLSRGNAARAALSALKEGKVLAMTYDQNAPRREGVFVPFFGRLACTRDAPVRIAMRTGAPVVPIFLHRLPSGDRHVARVYPPLELVPAGEDKQAATLENARRMSAVIEREIRAAPEQWTWIHRRWRTQPVGEPHPY